MTRKRKEKRRKRFLLLLLCELKWCVFLPRRRRMKPGERISSGVSPINRFPTFRDFPSRTQPPRTARLVFRRVRGDDFPSFQPDLETYILQFFFLKLPPIYPNPWKILVFFRLFKCPSKNFPPTFLSLNLELLDTQ